MSPGSIIFLVLFIIVLGVFAYISAKDGFSRSLNSLLRVLIPMVLSGLIVLITSLILSGEKNHNIKEMIRYIVAAIGIVIFYLVLKSVIKNPEKKKLNIFGIFMGFLVGIVEGWLVSGIFVNYLFYLDLFNVRKVLDAMPLYDIIVRPVKWLLFFDFS